MNRTLRRLALAFCLVTCVVPAASASATTGPVPGLPAAALAVMTFIAAPAIGVLLYVVLFRFLRLASALIKVVATVGIAVAIPPVANLCFGDKPILIAPGIAARPLRVFHFFDVPDGVSTEWSPAGSALPQCADAQVDACVRRCDVEPMRP